MRLQFTDFQSWKEEAYKRGWVHVHDQYVVCDDVASGACVGEWSDEHKQGWLETN